MDAEARKKLREMGGVEVMKASAGSGKTFALAREYIKLLLEKDDRGRTDPYAYRHILAVTFTNKATDEMKSRIIKELDKLARDPEDSKYSRCLVEECGYGSSEEISRAARKSLDAILNDYGAFSVSTIDRFFQQALRAFAREIGQFSDYQIELDRASLVGESVDRVLDSITEDSALLGWLSESSIDSIEEGEGYKLERNLGDFAQKYMSTAYGSKAEALGIDEKKAFSAENLRKLRGICRDITKKYDEDFRRAVLDADSYLQGLECYGKDKTINTHILNRIEEWKVIRPGEKAFKMPGDSLYWKNAVLDGNIFTAAQKKKMSQSDLDTTREVFRKIDHFFGRPLQIRRTAELLRGQISLFRVAESLKSQFNNLLKEKNVLSLDDTNSILRDIIGKTDAPFIYEKLGVRYRHFLLDEFQDTSTIQWENFRPLLENSIADACYNLVVGDVKQSIYRWRDADWKILDSSVEAQLPRVVNNPLLRNWRSARNIIDFNNRFFAKFAEKLDMMMLSRMGGVEGCEDFAQDRIRSIYADVRQEVPRDLKVPGAVTISFCDSDDLGAQTLDAVREACQLGFQYNEIAVIVRTNSLGGEVAAELIGGDIPVVTNDSLKVSAGETVRRLVARLYRLDDSADKINSFYAGDFDASVVEGCLSLTDMAEALLRQMPAEEVDRDTLYVLAFMDILRDYVSKWGNSLHSFLQYWESDGACRAISSPEGGNAVTIITIHKAKGLDYPYVIIPLPKSDVLMKGDYMSWEFPDIEGTEFEAAGKALYNVNLSERSADTLFHKNYLRELQMAYIDTANTWYVAMTRASEAMHIIVPRTNLSKDTLMCPKGGDWPAISCIGSALYLFAARGDNGFHPDDVPQNDFDRAAAEAGEPVFFERYVLGEPRGKAERDSSEPVRMIPLTVSGSCGTRQGNIKVKSDAKDFFDPELEVSYSSSRRFRGTVLHKVMEYVRKEEDLSKAVSRVADSGALSLEEAHDAETVLAAALKKVRAYGWFTAADDEILDEREIITADGSILRPDRVLIRNGVVDIIDYKFGRKNDEYVDQVRKYAAQFRAMGYSEVHHHLWYVGGDVDTDK